MMDMDGQEEMEQKWAELVKKLRAIAPQTLAKPPQPVPQPHAPELKK